MGSLSTRRMVFARCLLLTGTGLTVLATACDSLPGRDSGGPSTENDDAPAEGSDGGPTGPHTDGGEPSAMPDSGTPDGSIDADTPHEPDAALPDPDDEVDAAPPVKPNYVRVEAEDFLPGPDGYYDTTPENQGFYGRLDEGVDVGTATDLESPTLAVGYIRPGEWLRYALVLEETAGYTLRARVAHEAGGGQFSVYVDDELLTRFEVPNTGGWQSWVWIDHAIGALPAGEHTLKITADTGGLNGADAGNLNFFDFVPSQADGGLPESDGGKPDDAGESDPDLSPVRVETEAFLPGPDGYSDTTPQNEGGFGNLSEGVDVGFAGDPETPGSLCIGYTKPGEWLLYTLELEHTAVYTLRARVAHAAGGGDFSVYVDDRLVTTFTVPSTGSWGTWVTVEKALGALEAGAHTLKLTVDTGGFEGSDAGNVNYLEFVPGAPVVPNDGGLPVDASAPHADAGENDAATPPSDAGAPPSDAGGSHTPDGGTPPTVVDAG